MNALSVSSYVRVHTERGKLKIYKRDETWAMEQRLTGVITECQECYNPTDKYHPHPFTDTPNATILPTFGIKYLFQACDKLYFPSIILIRHMVRMIQLKNSEKHYIVVNFIWGLLYHTYSTNVPSVNIQKIKNCDIFGYYINQIESDLPILPSKHFWYQAHPSIPTKFPSKQFQKIKRKINPKKY